MVSAEKGQATIDFANDLGLPRGVGGFVYHGIPVVIHCWLTHQSDFRSALESIIACGGDTDTNAAMVGGILGTSLGVDSIPTQWVDRLLLAPLSIQSIDELARQVSDTMESGKSSVPASPPWIMLFVRNLFFLAIVLAYGFRRLAPPYG